MTIKQIETAIADGNIPENKVGKWELVIAATKSFAKTIQDDLNGIKMHNEETVKFLKSKHFKDALLDAILYSLEYKETSNPLKREELKLLKNKKATHAHYLDVCEKLSAGIIHAIGVSDEDDDTINLMLQEVICRYIVELESKLAKNQ